MLGNDPQGIIENVISLNLKHEVHGALPVAEDVHDIKLRLCLRLVVFICYFQKLGFIGCVQNPGERAESEDLQAIEGHLHQATPLSFLDPLDVVVFQVDLFVDGVVVELFVVKSLFLRLHVVRLVEYIKHSSCYFNISRYECSTDNRYCD